MADEIKKKDEHSFAAREPQGATPEKSCPNCGEVCPRGINHWNPYSHNWYCQQPAPEPLCVCGHGKRRHQLVSLLSGELTSPNECMAMGCKCLLFRPAQPAQGEGKCPKCGGELFHDCGPTGDKSHMLCFQCDLTDEQRAGFGRPDSAQAVSAEERALTCAKELPISNVTDERNASVIVRHLTAHAAAEVAWVEGERQKDKAAYNEVLGAQERQFAQLRETLAQKEEEVNQAHFACSELRRELERTTNDLFDSQQALARVEKERDEWISRTGHSQKMHTEVFLERDALKAQVAELVKERDEARHLVIEHHERKLRARERKWGGPIHSHCHCMICEPHYAALSTLEPKGQE